VRDGILSSKNINELDHEEENFYRRLLNIVDDYGRFFCTPALIWSGAYPLRPEQFNAQRIEQILHKLNDLELITIYEADGDKYLEINNFKQRTRSESKFPEKDLPPNDGQVSDKGLQDAALDEGVDEGVDEGGHVYFEQFWDGYPRKENKKRAETAFKNLSKQNQLKAIQDSGERYKHTDKKFIPHATTYINGERWNDEKPKSQKQVVN
jgi:hypothetical protein